MPRNLKGIVRLDLTVEEAEQLGYHIYDYALTYKINGAKFLRVFDSRKAKDRYANVLIDNLISVKLKVSPAKRAKR